MLPQPICSIIGCIDRIEDTETEYIKDEKHSKSYKLRQNIRQAIKDGFTVFACSGDNRYNTQGLLVLLQELGAECKYKNIVVNPIYNDKPYCDDDIWAQLDTLPIAGIHLAKGYSKKAISVREKWLREPSKRVIEIE